MSKLQQVVDSYPGLRHHPHIVCADGFTLSVQASEFHYCNPRPASEGFPPIGNDRPRGDASPFTAVEVGYPSERPEPWGEWVDYCETPSEPTATVYGYVPVDLVRRTIELHGGEA